MESGYPKSLKLYLTKPDYDESWIERNLIEDRKRINSEEDYRRIYQVGGCLPRGYHLLTQADRLWFVVLRSM
jgi:hypothetical protein